MGIIVADLFVTLDGVYQAPGGRDEDLEGGFEFGGWQSPFLDDAAGEDIGANIERMDALLLGRRTYDIFAGYWPAAGDRDPIATKLNSVPKFVVSTTLAEATWPGTEVLPHAMAAAELRDRYDEVHTIGSGDLLQSLLREDAVERLNLWLHPVVLGQGKRVFPEGAAAAAFRLARPARTFEGGAVSLVYERAGNVRAWDIDEGR